VSKVGLRPPSGPRDRGDELLLRVELTVRATDRYLRTPDGLESDMKRTSRRAAGAEFGNPGHSSEINTDFVSPRAAKLADVPCQPA
jgi:hypothetical protein